MTPVEELRAAAFRLREVAANAADGPWTASPVWSSRSHATSAVYSLAHDAGSVESEVVASGLAERSGGTRSPFNAVWIALMHPGLAEPLAALLESIADEAERHAAKGWGNDQSEIADGRYLAIARLINGGRS